jgi:hypothetical protein
MMYDRIEPLTPIKEPTDTRSGLSNMKPGLLSAKQTEKIKSEYLQRQEQILYLRYVSPNH